MLKEMFKDSDNIDEESLSIKESNDSKIVKLCECLKEIAVEAASIRPDLSKRICFKLG